MRQAVSIIIASVLLGSGLWLLYLQLFESRVIKGWFLMAAGLLIFTGGAWLIEDFIRPIFRRRKV